MGSLTCAHISVSAVSPSNLIIQTANLLLRIIHHYSYTWIGPSIIVIISKLELVDLYSSLFLNTWIGGSLFIIIPTLDLVHLYSSPLLHLTWFIFIHHYSYTWIGRAFRERKKRFLFFLFFILPEFWVLKKKKKKKKMKKKKKRSDHFSKCTGR